MSSESFIKILLSVVVIPCLQIQRMIQNCFELEGLLSYLLIKELFQLWK